tara:strand:- start:153690 stop:154340 length:651 start_codon:yes stop_codon:yes gene_type:complete
LCHINRNAEAGQVAWRGREASDLQLSFTGFATIDDMKAAGRLLQDQYFAQRLLQAVPEGFTVRLLLGPQPIKGKPTIHLIERQQYLLLPCMADKIEQANNIDIGPLSVLDVNANRLPRNRQYCFSTAVGQVEVQGRIGHGRLAESIADQHQARRVSTEVLGEYQAHHAASASILRLQVFASKSCGFVGFIPAEQSRTLIPGAVRKIPAPYIHSVGL